MPDILLYEMNVDKQNAEKFMVQPRNTNKQIDKNYKNVWLFFFFF